MVVWTWVWGRIWQPGPLEGVEAPGMGQREADPRAEVRAWGRKDKGALRSCPGTKLEMWRLRIVIRLDRGLRGWAVELRRDPGWLSGYLW